MCVQCAGSQQVVPVLCVRGRSVAHMAAAACPCTYESLAIVSPSKTGQPPYGTLRPLPPLTNASLPMWPCPLPLQQEYGEKRWAMVAQFMPGRTGKGCSHRWRAYLRPDVQHPHLSPFTEWEAAVIVMAQKENGNNWMGEQRLHEVGWSCVGKVETGLSPPWL